MKSILLSLILTFTLCPVTGHAEAPQFPPAPAPPAGSLSGGTSRHPPHLHGTLEGTPSSTVSCSPLEVRYAARNAEADEPLNASLRIEISSTHVRQVVYRRALPSLPASGVERIERVELPSGDYRIALRASAADGADGPAKEVLLAEQPLTVTGPVQLIRSPAVFPRVLLWRGTEDASRIDRALAEKIIGEAFEHEDLYLNVVVSAEDFANQAATGLYNVYLLLNVGGMLDPVSVIRNGLAGHAAVIIAGSDERSLAIAEAFGFRFGRPRSGSGLSVTFPEGSGARITGTLPVSGKVLPPAKPGAKEIAVFSDDRQPAVLLDSVEGGALLVIPFSLTRSALHTGISSIYALLLRSAVQSIAPERGDEGDIGAMQLVVSSPTGPVTTRIVETLPVAATMIWTSETGPSRNSSESFDVTAVPEPRTIRYLYRLRGSDRQTSSEILYECGGNLMRQGTVE
jgi:hypothetical protein